MNCHNCVKGRATFLIDQNKLVVPKSFLERPTTRTGHNDSYVCNETVRGDISSTPCDCVERCNGSPDFCTLFQCDNESSCFCEVQKVEYELLHITDDSTIVNPSTLTIPVCLYRLPGQSTRSRNRRLLEFESASFVNHNLTLLFNDPVVTVPEPGTLIARISGNEIIFEVVKDRNVVLPPKLVSFSGKMTLIFISSSGRAIHGEVILDGKTICRSTNCVICKEFLQQTTCWPKYLAYPLYVIFFILITISLFLLKFAIKSVIFSIKFVCGVIFLIFKIARSLLRCSLLGGAIFGQNLRQNYERINHYLEDNNPRLNVQPGLALMLLVSLIAHVSSDCTSHSIISSENRNCKHIGEQQICELYTSAEVTLRGLDYKLCLWMQDPQRQTIVSLKLRLISADCTFSTRREYFTFPVETRHISQLACPQNAYCAWGTHCKADKDLEALTEESQSYPGTTNCLPSSVGSGCTIVSRMGCLFYRTYFVPDLLRSYEIRSITGHRCGYKVSVEKSGNETAEHITLQTSATTSDGIYMEVLGAYSQPQVHFGLDALVLRVGDPTEAYLTPVSATSRPVSGMIGQIQANNSYSKHFIFDPEITKCDFFETTLRCKTISDGISSLVTTKEKALPLSKDLHLLAMNRGSITSQLLSTETN